MALRVCTGRNTTRIETGTFFFFFFSYFKTGFREGKYSFENPGSGGRGRKGRKFKF